MSAIGPRHQKLDETGEGLCSVPMFLGGGSAGFCDKRAFGERPDGRSTVRWDGYEYRDDGLYAGYVPGLACIGHGGPKVRTFMDGNAWCAVHPGFINLQESAAGFGETKGEALAALARIGGAA